MTLNQNPQMLDAVTFGLDFWSDADVRKAMKMHYLLQDWVYPDAKLMAAQLQAVADLQKDYYNKLWETTQYKYDPIENYNMVEEVIKDKTTTTDNGTSTTHPGEEGYNTRTDNYNYPDDEGTEKRVAANNDTITGSMVNDSSNTHTNEREYKFQRHGNIGVTTSQQMIDQERKLLIHIDEMYLREFDDYFMITM